MNEALRLAVIPPCPITQNGRMEVRCSNPDAVITVAGEQIVPGPDGAWWKPQGRTGTFEVSATVGGATVRDEVVVTASQTRAVPWFQGFWLDPGGIAETGYERVASASEADARRIVDAIADLQARFMVLTYVEYLGAFYYPSEIEFFDRDIQGTSRGNHLDFDLVEAVLDQADRRDMAVFLGVGRGGDTPLLWEFDEPGWDARLAEGLTISRDVASELWQRYGAHASFYGWYFTHEMNDLARASAYYDPLARHCRALAPEKPVLVAPAGTPIVTDASLRASEVDIFAYQDAVGAGYVPYEYTWDPARRIVSLPQIYESYATLHAQTPKHLWSDTETWEMDGSQGYKGAYPPSMDRVRRQIDAEAPHVDVLTAYEYSGFLEAADIDAKLVDPRARELHAAYERYVKEMK